MKLKMNINAIGLGLFGLSCIVGSSGICSNDNLRVWVSVPLFAVGLYLATNKWGMANE